MTCWDIWLNDGGKVEATGDRIEEFALDDQARGFHVGDLVITKGDRVIGHFKRERVAGYVEQERLTIT